MNEITIEELKEEILRGSRVILMVRHAERPKMDPNDPSFGDALELTYDGTRTARKLGEMLAEFRGNVGFYASPLTRTRMTAACIAEGMGIANPSIPTDDLLGNGSFYYEDASEVLEIFKPNNFFPACFEYFRTGRQRGFRELHQATDEMEKWLFDRFERGLFVVATHDLYVAAFLVARGAVGEFTRENWVRFLDGAAIIVSPDGTRRYALVRTGLSEGIVGVHRPKINGVVFDFGGVMTMSTMPERVRRCVDEFGINWECLERGFARYRRLMDGDYMTLEEMYELIWADAGIEIPKSVKERILEEDRASFMEGYRNLDTLEWMRELKAKGYRIGILTNMPTDFAKQFRRVYSDFIELADAMVISGEERMFKPQRRIYELMQKRFGIPAAEICFVDDVEANCEGARAAGWQAIRFEGNERVKIDFRRMVG